LHCPPGRDGLRSRHALISAPTDVPSQKYFSQTTALHWVSFRMSAIRPL
jgi:hypothetical protein